MKINGGERRERTMASGLELDWRWDCNWSGDRRCDGDGDGWLLLLLLRVVAVNLENKEGG
jgi:hypothetical protein